MVEWLVKNRKPNIQLNWCKDNNFEEEHFETGSVGDLYADVDWGF